MSIRKLTPTATVFIALGLNTLLFDILANRLLINIVSDTGIKAYSFCTYSVYSCRNCYVSIY